MHNGLLSNYSLVVIVSLSVSPISVSNVNLCNVCKVK